MIVMNDVVTLKEYDYLVYNDADKRSANSNSYKRIPKTAFKELIDLINDSSSDDENDYDKIFRLYGRRIQVQGFVGVIQTPDGTQIEILPKIAETKKTSAEIEKANDSLRRILRNMVIEVEALPGRKVQTASMETEKFSLLEMFISDFLECVDAIVKRGIRSDYIRQEDNLPFMKGKLLINQQIKYNSVHRERFYVEFDSFESNRPENRLIKSSLQKVLKMSGDYLNQRLARELLFMFDDVPFSTDYKQDFQKCSKDRGMHYYQDALTWSRLILEDKSPMPTAGEKTFRSFLFPMWSLFEKYVAIKVGQKLREGYSPTPQASLEHLCTHNGKGKFKIEPDLLVEKDDKTEKFVLDAKWKLISNKKDNYGINQDDFYHMFAYGHKYLGGKGKMALIYPKTDDFEVPLNQFYFDKNKNLTLWVVPFDLDSDEFITLRKNDSSRIDFFDQILKPQEDNK